MSVLFFATCWGQIAITSEQIRYCTAGFGIAITLASILVSWHKRSFTWAPLCGFLILLHPAWTMSLEAGDCGLRMRFLSVATSLVMATILTFQIFWPHLVSKRRFLLGLCVISWIAYLTCWPLSSILSHLSLFPTADDGFAAQAVLCFITAENDLLTISLVLTCVCVVQGMLNWTRPQRLPQAQAPGRRSLDNGVVDHITCSSELKPAPLWKSRVRVSSLAILLALIALHGSSLIVTPVIGLSSILALGWSVILLISAVRGKFPGWGESGT
jgi:hypothetical protein